MDNQDPAAGGKKGTSGGKGFFRIMLVLGGSIGLFALLDNSGDTDAAVPVVIFSLLFLMLVTRAIRKKKPPAAPATEAADNKVSYSWPAQPVSASPGAPVPVSAPGRRGLHCVWCGAVVSGKEGRCSACGGPVRILDPAVVECGWCGLSNRRDKTAVCTACGGPLPSIPGKPPGAEPPPAPRQLPPGYRTRLLWKSVIFPVCLVIFLLSGSGLAIAAAADGPEVLLIFLVPFTLLWGFCMLFFFWWTRRWVPVLRHGVPTRGVLKEVTFLRNSATVEWSAGKKDGKTAVSLTNDPETPRPGGTWLLTWEYDTPQGSFSCTAESRDPASSLRLPGERFWVLYLENKPDKSALWPPLR